MKSNNEGYIKCNLPSFNVDKKSIKDLETYLIFTLPEKLNLENRDYSDDLVIFISKKKYPNRDMSYKKCKTIDKYKKEFNDEIKSIKIKFSEEYGDQGLYFILNLDKDKIANLEIKDYRKRASEIKQDVFNILKIDEHKNKYIYVPEKVEPFLGLSIIIAWLAYGFTIRDESPDIEGKILIFYFWLGLIYFFIYKSLTPYVGFGQINYNDFLTRNYLRILLGSIIVAAVISFTDFDIYHLIKSVFDALGIDYVE